MGRFRLEMTALANLFGNAARALDTDPVTCVDLGQGIQRTSQQRPRISGLRLSAIGVLAAGTLLLGQARLAFADYLGTSPAQVVVDPKDIAAVLADGLQTGDQFRLIGAVTPGNTGSNSAQSGWNTFYTIPGMRVTRVEIVDNAGGGNYVTIPAKDTDAAYNGWGSRGNKNYTAATADGQVRLDDGFINQVQQDSGIFYSTDPRTKYVPGASAPPAPGTPPSYGTVNVTGGLQILPKPVAVHNIWDRDQASAFGATTALSGNGGTGDTPLITLNNGALWRGTGSPVAGPQTYYTNDYNPNCGKAGTDSENPNNVFPYDYTTPGNPATKTDSSRPAQTFVPLTVGVNGVTAAEKTLLEGFQCIGPWRRIVYQGSKIGGPATPPTPATATGAILNTATPVTAANKGDNILADFGGFLPAATNAIRFVTGARRVGDVEYFAVTIRITDVNQFLANAQNMCVMSLGSDTADLSAKDNNWRYYEPIFLQGRGSSQYCIDLSANGNLSKQATHVNNVSSSAQAISVNDVVSYTIKFTNTTAQTINGLVLTDLVGPGIIIGNGNLDLVNSANAGCAYKPGGAGGHTGYNATFSLGSAATGGTLASPADTAAGFPAGFNGPATWNSVNNLAPGESVTVYMCSKAAQGTQGDLLENESQASYTGCGAAPCFVASAFSAIGNIISGTVYRDSNSNGALDAGETGIAGVAITLYLDDGIAGQFNATGANANTFVAQTATGPDGAYNFTSVPAGNYIVVETDLAGYTSTGNIIHVGGPCPNAGSANVCNVIGGITVGATGSVTGRDFYDFAPPLPILTKSFSPTTISSGGNAVLTFTIDNSAANSVAVSGLFFTDILPIGIVLNNGNAVAGATCGTPTVTDNNGAPLASGSTSVKVTGVTISAGNVCLITVNVTNFNGQLNSKCPNAAPDFTNTANNITDISPNTPPNGLINAIQPSCLTVLVNPPSLNTSKVVSTVNGVAASAGTIVKAGDIITYTITVTNSGGSSGTTVLSDPVPVNTTYTGTGEGWSCANPSPAGTACTQSVTVAAGATATRSYSLTVITPIPPNTTTIGNVVTTSVGTCTPSCNPTNPTPPVLNTRKDVTTVNGAAATPATLVKAGDTIVYSIVVSNTGGSPDSTTLTDNVPANTTFAGAPADGWSCAAGAVAGTACTQTVSNLAAGASSTKIYTVTVNTPVPPNTTTIGNLVTTSSGTCTPSCNPTNPTGPVLDTVKTISTVNGAPATSGLQGTLVKAGDVIVYTITVTNVGGASGSTTLTDVVPANTTYTGTGQGWSCTNPSSAGTPCTQGVTVAAGGTVAKSYTLTVNTPVPAGITTIGNAVTTSTGTCSTCSTTNPLVPILATTKVITSVNGVGNVDQNTVVKAGDVIVYTITVTNTGGSNGTTLLTDTVPVNTRYTGTTEGWSCPQNSPSGTSCSQLVTATPGSSVPRTYTLTVNNPLPPNTTTIANLVTTSVGICNPCNPSNPTGPILNTTKFVMTVNGAAANAATVVKAGDVVVYIITVTNQGGTAGTTQLTDIVPANTKYTGPALEQWSCTAPAPAGTSCQQPITVAPGASVAKTFTLTIDNPLPMNTASVANLVTTSVGTCSSCNPNNPTAPVLNTRKDVTSVNGIAATPATQVKAGDVIVYTITVTNPGGLPGTTTLSDAVPLNTRYTGTGELWSCATGSPAGTTCAQSVTVAAGGTQTRTYTLTVDTPLPPNTATVSNLVTSSVGTCLPSCNPSNPTAPVLNTVKNVTTVNGAAATTATQVKAGDVITYTITVTNSGGQSGTTVLSDIVPANTTYSGIGEGWTCPNGSVAGTACTQSVTVAPSGGTVTKSYTLTVNTPLPAGTNAIANLVTTSVGTCSSCNPSNPTASTLNTSKVVTSVNGAPATPATLVKSGDVIVYTITVTNIGGQPGTTVLSDAVPGNTRYTGVGEGWGCPTNSVAGTPCTQAVTVPANGTQTKTFTLTVNTPLPANTTNIANLVTTSVGTCLPSCNPSNPTSPLLDTVKTVTTVNGAAATTATVVKAGDVIGYTITVTNTGGSSGTTLLGDTVPINTTYTGAGQGWSCATNSAAGTSCTQSVTVASGASVSKTYTLTVVTPLPAGTSTIANLVTTSVGTCSSCNPSNPTASTLNTSKVVTSVNGAPATPATQVGPGDVIVYTITVTNPGGLPGTTVLSDTVPTNTRYTGAGEGWSCAANSGPGTPCTQSVTVPANGTSSKTYTITVNSPLPPNTTTIGNLVTTSIGTCLPSCNPSNPTGPLLNTSKSVTTVNGFAATPATQVKAGDVIVYTITVNNTGGLVGTTQLGDAVPANTRYIGVGEGWSCPTNSVAGTACSQSVTVAAGATTTKTYTLSVNTPLPANTATIGNLVTSTVGTCTPICNPTNPTGPVLDTTKLIMSVNGAPATSATVVKAGDVIVYIVAVTNSGGNLGTTLVTDIVPANTTYTGSGEGWSCASGSIAGTSCSQSLTVNAGASVAKTYTLTVANPLPQGTATIANLVTTSVGTCSSCNPNNPTTPVINTQKQVTSVNGAAATSATQVKGGDVIVYTITVTNPGGQPGTTVLTDNVPANTVYTGSGQGWSCATGSVAGTACTQSVTVAAGASVTKQYTLTVNSPLPANVTTIGNLVTTSVGTCVPTCNPTNPVSPVLNTTKTVTTVNGTPASAATVVAAGDVIVYTISVINTGGLAGSTVLTDVVPANTVYVGSGEGWSCATNSPAATSCTQTVNVGPSGAMSTVTYTLKVNTPIPANVSTIANLVATSVGTCSSCNPSNPTAVPRTFTFGITKAASQLIVQNGAPLSFTIVVTNNGPAAADGSIITDPAIPLYSVNGVTCLGTTGGATCPTPLTVAALQSSGATVATFPSGATVTLRIDGISSLVQGDMTNTATVSPPTSAPTVTPVSAVATVSAQNSVVPTMSPAGLITLMVLVGLSAGYLRRRSRQG